MDLPVHTYCQEHITYLEELAQFHPDANQATQEAAAHEHEHVVHLEARLATVWCTL